MAQSKKAAAEAAASEDVLKLRVVRAHRAGPVTTPAPDPEQFTEDAELIARELLEHTSWSAKIRYLYSRGFKKSSIAFMLGELRGYPMSVQHVNNVLSRPLKGTGQGGRGPGRPKLSEDPRALEVLSILPKIIKPEA